MYEYSWNLTVLEDKILNNAYMFNYTCKMLLISTFIETYVPKDVNFRRCWPTKSINFAASMNNDDFTV